MCGAERSDAEASNHGLRWPLRFPLMTAIAQGCCQNCSCITKKVASKLLPGGLNASLSTKFTAFPALILLSHHNNAAHRYATETPYVLCSMVCVA